MSWFRIAVDINRMKAVSVPKLPNEIAEIFYKHDSYFPDSGVAVVEEQKDGSIRLSANDKEIAWIANEPGTPEYDILKNFIDSPEEF